MSRLSKQSIRKLCEPLPGVDALPHIPMISPFEPNKVRVQGVSKGLSHASYDASIAHDLVLGRHPGYVIKGWVSDHFSEMDWNNRGYHPKRWYHWPAAIMRATLAVNKLLSAFGDLRKRLADEPPAYSLAYTVEDFCMPANVGGDVADKSTFARVFVSAFNTFFDPGFHGNATLELVNQSDQRVEYKAGQGVCQFIFTWLDEATEAPYDGKYQHQTQAAHGPRYETAMPTVPPAGGGHNLSWSGQKGERRAQDIGQWPTLPAGPTLRNAVILDGCVIHHSRDPVVGENLNSGEFGVSHDKAGTWVTYPDGSLRLVKP